MVCKGHILEKGLVELEGNPALPAGTAVTVQVAGEVSPEILELRKLLLSFAGKASGLPPDASRNVDHYVYGLPKK